MQCESCEHSTLTASYISVASTIAKDNTIVAIMAKNILCSLLVMGGSALCCFSLACACDGVRVYVVNRPGDWEPASSTSIRFDADFLVAVGLENALVNNILQVFPCSNIVGINTDHEDLKHRDIDEWIKFDCQSQECYVVSEYKYSFPSSSDPYDLRAERTMKTKLLPFAVVLHNNYTKPCQEIKDEAKCVHPCVYFGFFYQCREADFCGFRAKEACEMHEHCVFRKHCVNKVILSNN